MRGVMLVFLVGCSTSAQQVPPDGSGAGDGPRGDGTPDATLADAAMFPDAQPMAVDPEWSSWMIAAPNFQVIGDVARDTTTGLEWQRTASAAMSWLDADFACTQLGSGWRLPTLVELSSLVDYSAWLPSIATSVFPDTPSQDFWTTSKIHAVSGYRWVVYFRWGSTNQRQETSNAHARCVRSANTTVTGGAGAPAGRYTVTTDTVRDTVTGLRWQRVPPTTSMVRGDAVAYCESLVLAGSSTWRVPTLPELQSLVDVRRSNPTSDAALSTTSSFYFAATTYQPEPQKGWSVDFSSGQSQAAGVAMPAYVRCVE